VERVRHRYHTCDTHAQRKHTTWVHVEIPSSTTTSTTTKHHNQTPQPVPQPNTTAKHHNQYPQPVSTTSTTSAVTFGQMRGRRCLPLSLSLSQQDEPVNRGRSVLGVGLVPENRNKSVRFVVVFTRCIHSLYSLVVFTQENDSHTGSNAPSRGPWAWYDRY
jgi:hypothetical protein